MKTQSNLFLTVVFGVALSLFAALSLSIGVMAETELPDAPDLPDMSHIFVAHYAPFASEIVSTSVTVRVNGTDAITDLVFGEKAGPIVFPAGAYTVEIVPTGAVTPALTFTATVENGKDYTLAAIGGANGWPLERAVSIDNASPSTTTALLRISHLAPFSTTLNGTKVDICTDAGIPVPGLTGIAYKTASGFFPLAAGVYNLKVAAAGTGCAAVALDLPPFAVHVGQVADIVAIGLIGSANLPLQTQQSGLVARVAIGHFAPFAKTPPNTIPISTAVTVRVTGTDVLTNFIFSQLTPYLPIALGAYPLQIIPTGATTPVISGTLVISGLLDHTAAAIGNGALQPLALTRLIDDNATPPPAGKARVRIAHMAPFDANVNLTAVDICIAVGQPPIISGLKYGESRVRDLDAGFYKLYAASAGTNCLFTVADIPEFAVTAGQIAYVYALGDGVNIAPTVLARPDISVKKLFLPVIDRGGTVQ